MSLSFFEPSTYHFRSPWCSNSSGVFLDKRPVLLQRVHAGPGERHLDRRIPGNTALQPVPDPAATRSPGRKRCQLLRYRRRAARLCARREVGPRVTDLAPSLCRYTTTSRMTCLTTLCISIHPPRTSSLARPPVESADALTLTKDYPARRRPITLLFRRLRAAYSRRFTPCIHPGTSTRETHLRNATEMSPRLASDPPHVDARRGGS